jgi:recombination protein RecR
VRLPEGFKDVVRACTALPGIGERSAQRFAFYLLDKPEKAREIAKRVGALAERVGRCVRCYNLAERDRPTGLCVICEDPSRDTAQLCVVENIPHLIAIESSGTFLGTYHVLHGVLSPIKGITPEHLHFPELSLRITEESVQEVIIATDVDVEGEATAAYIVDLLSGFGVIVSRIATGVPMGSDLEFLDATTLSRALEGRRRQDDSR